MNQVVLSSQAMAPDFQKCIRVMVEAEEAWYVQLEVRSGGTR